MAADLVFRVIEQSREREPLTTAVALLYSSRVLAAVEPSQAKQAFAEGVAIVQALALRFSYSRPILLDAIHLGSFSDPLAAADLFRRSPQPHPDKFTGDKLVESLAKHGHFEAALALLEDPDSGGARVQPILHHSSDPAIHRRALAAARDYWRTDHSATLSFYHLFSDHWRKLDPPAQHSWLDEILISIQSRTDHPLGAQFGPSLAFQSLRPAAMFFLLGPLRHLKSPAEIEAILLPYPDVAAAAEQYPFGLESILALLRTPQPPAGTVTASSGPVLDPDTQPGKLLSEAHYILSEDTDPRNPNYAPHVYWPSCHAYRLAIYWAGKHQGREGARFLDQIPDPDFALLASIELAAALLDLPAYHGLRLNSPNPS